MEKMQTKFKTTISKSDVFSFTKFNILHTSTKNENWDS